MPVCRVGKGACEVSVCGGWTIRLESELAWPSCRFDRATAGWNNESERDPSWNPMDDPSSATTVVVARRRARALEHSVCVGVSWSATRMLR